MDIDIQIEREQPVQTDLSDPTAANQRLKPAFGTDKHTQEKFQRNGLTNERGTKRERLITPPPPSPRKSTNKHNPYDLYPYTPKTPRTPHTTHLSPHKLLTPNSNPRAINPNLEIYGNQFIRSPLTKKNLAAFEDSLRRSNARPAAVQDPWGDFGIASGMKRDRSGVSGGFGPVLRDARARAQMGGGSGYGSYPGYEGRGGGDAGLPGTRKSYGQLAFVEYGKIEGPELAHKPSSSTFTSKLRKKVHQQNKFGRPGPAGFWIPDDGVERQLPPSADLMGGGEEAYEEVPDYGGCEIWYDVDGDVVEERGMGWNDKM